MDSENECGAKAALNDLLGGSLVERLRATKYDGTVSAAT